MIKVREISGKQSFYESTTGQPYANINSVTFLDTPNAVVQTVSKNAELWVYVPSKNMTMFKLSDVVGKMGISVEKVS